MSALAYSLRPASQTDLAALLGIHEATFRAMVEVRFEWESTRQLERLLEGGLGQVVVIGDEVVGQWLVERRPTEFYLARVMLAPAVQGKGLGTQLIRDLQAEAATEGKTVLLQVWEENPARVLYERLGFVALAPVEFRVPMRWEP